MDEEHYRGRTMPDHPEQTPSEGDTGLDEESRRIFEEGYERYRKAMERLAEL